MEKSQTRESKFKKRMKAICFVPAFSFLVFLVYYAVLLSPIVLSQHAPATGVGIMSRHYDTLFALLAIFATASAGVLIYCIVHLLRVETLNTAKKMIWVLLLLATPISFILFWYLQVNDEPVNLPLRKNID